LDGVWDGFDVDELIGEGDEDDDTVVDIVIELVCEDDAVIEAVCETECVGIDVDDVCPLEEAVPVIVREASAERLGDAVEVLVLEALTVALLLEVIVIVAELLAVLLLVVYADDVSLDDSILVRVGILLDEDVDVAEEVAVAVAVAVDVAVPDNVV
jgi:hypothetical protein